MFTDKAPRKSTAYSLTPNADAAQRFSLGLLASDNRRISYTMPKYLTITAVSQSPSKISSVMTNTADPVEATMAPARPTCDRWTKSNGCAHLSTIEVKLSVAR